MRPKPDKKGPETPSRNVSNLTFFQAFVLAKLAAKSHFLVKMSQTIYLLSKAP
jgi:hypothetical protein